MSFYKRSNFYSCYLHAHQVKTQLKILILIANSLVTHEENMLKKKLDICDVFVWQKMKCSDLTYSLECENTIVKAHLDLLHADVCSLMLTHAIAVGK